MSVYWDEKEQCFMVPEGECPYPINGRDPKNVPCEDCGCGHREAKRLNEKTGRYESILIGNS